VIFEGSVVMSSERIRNRCQACGGTGVLAPTVPSCKIPARRGPWVVVEKCDACDRYVDDLAAASSLFEVAGWFACNNGSEHALANRYSTHQKPPQFLD